ncbi:MAG: SCO family protein [Rhodobacteraceae bacterium]|nr:SCO family protein [Paracoccaceae bacterium]
MNAKLIAILSACSILSVLTVTWIVVQNQSSGDQFAECRTTRSAGGTGAIGGPFELVNGDGYTVTDTDVITQPSILYFGYTFCPDLCPFDVVRNADVVDLLTARGQSVTPVFISIDPRRDTPDVIRDFTFNIHEKMIGLTGSNAQVKAASQAYRVYYNAHLTEDEYYLVDHTTHSYLVLPDHGFVEFFRRDITAEAMAEQVNCFLQNA